MQGKWLLQRHPALKQHQQCTRCIFILIFVLIIDLMLHSLMPKGAGSRPTWRPFRDLQHKQKKVFPIYLSHFKEIVFWEFYVFSFLYFLYCCRCCCCGKKDEDTNYNDDDRADVLHRISGGSPVRRDCRLWWPQTLPFPGTNPYFARYQVPGAYILQVIARLREACIVVWLYLGQWLDRWGFSAMLWWWRRRRHYSLQRF